MTCVKEEKKLSYLENKVKNKQFLENSCVNIDKYFDRIKNICKKFNNMDEAIEILQRLYGFKLDDLNSELEYENKRILENEANKIKQFISSIKVTHS